MSFSKIIVNHRPGSNISMNSCRDEVACQVAMYDLGISPEVLGSEATCDFSIVEMRSIDGFNFEQILLYVMGRYPEDQDRFFDAMMIMVKKTLLSMYGKISDWKMELTNLMMDVRAKVWVVDFEFAKMYPSGVPESQVQNAIDVFKQRLDLIRSSKSTGTEGEKFQVNPTDPRYEIIIDAIRTHLASKTPSQGLFSFNNPFTSPVSTAVKTGEIRTVVGVVSPMTVMVYNPTVNKASSDPSNEDGVGLRQRNKPQNSPLSMRVKPSGGVSLETTQTSSLGLNGSVKRSHLNSSSMTPMSVKTSIDEKPKTIVQAVAAWFGW